MTEQPTLDFDGHTLSEDPDAPRRLTGQMLRVVRVMGDGQWRTLATLALLAAPATEASVSARLRDLRKPKFGGHTVERKLVAPGLYEYRVALNQQARVA